MGRLWGRLLGRPGGDEAGGPPVAAAEPTPEPLGEIVETNSIWPPSGRRNYPGPWQRIETGYGWAERWPIRAAARSIGFSVEIFGPVGATIMDPDECAMHPNAPTRNISRSIN